MAIPVICLLASESTDSGVTTLFIVWRDRPVKGKGGGPFLLGDKFLRGTYDACCWKPLACKHRGEGRVAHTPLLMISERKDGKPRQRVLYRFPTIRSCCIADRFNRAAWWYEVRSFLDHVDDCYCEEGTYLPRDRAAILAKLLEVVPRPTPLGRAEFEAYRLEMEREREARDEADRAWWARESERLREERGRRSAEEARRAREEQARAWRDFEERIRGMAGTPGPADCFAVLEIRPNATADEVKAAYRRLVKVHHPDMGGDADAFNRVKVAYDRAMLLALQAGRATA
jgi:hypothetical protein